jgi:hypothetical protein
LTVRRRRKQANIPSQTLEDLQMIRRETMAVLREARATGANDLALKAIARLEKQLELGARLTGELNEAPTANILVTPEWAELRAAILAALESHPEAKSALVGVLDVKA